MAVITRELASFGDPPTDIRFEIDYDDRWSPMRIVAFRAINNTDHAVYGEAIRLSDGLLYGHRFPPGTTYIQIPTGPSERLGVTIDERGHLVGVQFNLISMYP